MSSWLDPYLNSLADKLGLRKSNAGFMADAMAQDPGAQSEVDRYANMGRAQNAAHGITEIPHWSEALKGKTGPQVVHLPPIQMQREDPPELPIRPETAYDIQRSQQPPARFNVDLLRQLQAAEERSGAAKSAYGRSNDDGKMMFYSPHQGRDMDENEAYAYLDFLEGR